MYLSQMVVTLDHPSLFVMKGLDSNQESTKSNTFERLTGLLCSDSNGCAHRISEVIRNFNDLLVYL